MARGIIRKPSFWKIVGAFRSQWKRSLRRMFIPGYGKKEWDGGEIRRRPFIIGGIIEHL